jgi:transcriptional regulator with XRE-family HTH domain
MTLGSRIAAWRRARGFSHRELAKAVGVTRAAVYQWEGSGESQTTPSLPHLEAVVKVLGLTMEKFYGPLPKREAKAS